MKNSYHTLDSHQHTFFAISFPIQKFPYKFPNLLKLSLKDICCKDHQEYLCVEKVFAKKVTGENPVYGIKKGRKKSKI